MFHQTAKALHAAAEQRVNDGGLTISAQIEDIALDLDAAGIETMREAAAAEAIAPVMSLGAASADELERLHSEFRWSESKLAHASERLAEAQEARRKDLVALACMRRELRASFSSERAYVNAQQSAFTTALPQLTRRENELAELVAGGALTAVVISDLAAVRAERKLIELAIGQCSAQLARVDTADATLEYEVASETYDLEPDGRTMRELARLRSESTRLKRAAAQARSAARELMELLGIDTTHGEVTAVASFIAAEIEGDERSASRMALVRGAQMRRELADLPEPSSAWKAGLRHPVNFFRARRVSGPSTNP